MRAIKQKGLNRLAKPFYNSVSTKTDYNSVSTKQTTIAY